MDSMHSGITFDNSCIVQSDKMNRGDQSIESQKQNWTSKEKAITGLVERLEFLNIQFTVGEISKHDLIHGRGLFCKALMKCQLRSPNLSNVYAAFAAVINSELPDVGLLLVKRVVSQFKEAYDSGNNKALMWKTSKFLAHLVNQSVVYELLALDVLMLLLGNPKSENVDVAVSFALECGSCLLDLAPHKMGEVLEEFWRVLREGVVEKRVRVQIMNLFAAKRFRFRRYPRIVEGLGFVDFEDQVTHEVSLLHDISPENSLNDSKPEFDEYGQMMVRCEESDDDEVSSRMIGREDG